MGNFQLFVESEEQVQQMKDILTKLYYEKGLAPEDVAGMVPFELAVAIQHVTGRSPERREVAMLKQVARNM